MMENYFVLKSASIEPMIERAISLAKYYGLNIHAGVPNNASGDCALESILDQLLTRKCFKSIFDERYDRGDPQFY